MKNNFYYWWLKASYEVVFEDAECFDINEKYIKECELNVDYDNTYGSKLDAYLEIIEIPYDSIKVRIVRNIINKNIISWKIE